MPPAVQTVSETEKAFFEKNGYLIVRAVFTSAEMAECKQAARETIEQKTGPSGVYVWWCDEIPPLFERISCDPRLVAILNPLLGPEIEFLSAKPVHKSAAITFASPWHQDRAYWGGAPKYSIWIALEEATEENGCLRVIPGSHREFLGHANVSDHNGFNNRVREEELKDAHVVDAPMHIGDILVFHDCLLHSSYPNRSGQDRWCFIPTYRNAAVPDVSTTWKTSRQLT
ncbi:MAG: phytanoyl-CoA dioxygenase family protein [candidate division Zixibacteria bacterium]|nr:phytanoyl-CoA dioxygenase family protein [candidate division Zixibacteria bacterium]